jgi:hypothetical protein
MAKRTNAICWRFGFNLRVIHFGRYHARRAKPAACNLRLNLNRPCIIPRHQRASMGTPMNFRFRVGWAAAAISRHATGMCVWGGGRISRRSTRGRCTQCGRAWQGSIL